jgi:protein TonB
MSAVLHAALGGAVFSVRPPPVREHVVVTMREVRRPRAPTPPPPSPPESTPAPAAAPATPPPAPRHRATPRPARASATPAASSASAAPGPAPDFGLTLGGESGGGIPIAAGGGAEPARESATRESSATPRPHADHDECSEEATRPRVVDMPEPEYPDAAREANIEGRVRVELTLDATGRVTGARVLQGLGHGLDEAALDAARGARFEPATRCGRAVATTFTLGVRFTL